MARFDFSAHWLEAPNEEAFGPERPTWASLELRVDDVVLTRHRADDSFVGDEEITDGCVGGLSGLAEWIVDHFPEVLWEATVPVPKHGLVEEGSRLSLPGLREAASWWSGYSEAADLRELATWQERHTFGAAASQLAVPSMVFVPEVGRVGLFVSEPPRELNPNIRFTLPRSAEYWLERDDLREQLARFVEGVLGRAEGDPDAKPWAAWLAERWSRSRRREETPCVRRELLYGKVVADLWEERIATLGRQRAVVEGVLSDVGELNSVRDFDELIGALHLEARGDNARWREHRATAASAPTAPMKAYEQGYELARKLRRDLEIGNEPIHRVDVILANLGIRDIEANAHRRFRAACCMVERRPVIVVSKELTVNPRRVAMAAALGRLLFDGRGAEWGSAIGDRSRWQETRRASAFAAELLAPAAAVAAYVHRPEQLADDYGISLASARWRLHNVVGVGAS